MNHACPNRCDVCDDECYAAQREVRPMHGAQLGAALLAGAFVVGFLVGGWAVVVFR